MQRFTSRVVRWRGRRRRVAASFGFQAWRSGYQVPGSRSISVVSYLVDGEEMLHEGFSLLTEALQLAPISDPQKTVLPSAFGRDWNPALNVLTGTALSCRVRLDDEVALELINFSNLSRLRKALRRPPVVSLISLYAEPGKSWKTRYESSAGAEPFAIESLRSHLDSDELSEDRKPRIPFWQYAYDLTNRSADYPYPNSVLPLLRVNTSPPADSSRCETSPRGDGDEMRERRETAIGMLRVKELVISHPNILSEQLSTARNVLESAEEAELLQSAAGLPNMWNLGAERRGPFLRLIPSVQSAIILKVYDHAQDEFFHSPNLLIDGRIVWLQVDSLEHSSRQLESLGLSGGGLGETAIHTGERIVSLKSLPGLHIRISEESKIQPFYLESYDSLLVGTVPELQSPRTSGRTDGQHLGRQNVREYGDCWMEVRAMAKQPSNFFRETRNH